MTDLSSPVLDENSPLTAVGSSTAQRIFLSAGEASGDAYAAALVGEIRAVCASRSIEEPRFEGVAGKKLWRSRVEVVADSSNWGALGIVEAIKVGPRVIVGFNAAKRAIRRGKPGLFVPIDYGFFNIRLCKVAKAAGWKVLYFIPPGSWRRDKQGADLPTLTDVVVTPFSWSADLLNNMGADARWFGHPLKQMILQAPTKFAFGAEPRDSIAILPGSRSHEIQHNLQPIAAALALDPELQMPVEFALATTADPDVLEGYWREYAPLRVNDLAFADNTYGILRRGRAGIICSGTATLEAALCGCPCVVVYRGGKLMELEYRIRKPKFDYISLPNILLNSAVVPELIQWDATPQRIRTELDDLLGDTPTRQRQLDAFKELSEILGASDALTKTAELALTMNQ